MEPVFYQPEPQLLELMTERSSPALDSLELPRMALRPNDIGSPEQVEQAYPRSERKLTTVSSGF